MNTTLRSWLLRPGIGRRIAATMVLSLVAVQAQAFLQVWLFATPEMQLTGTRWVAELVRDALHDTILLPLEERAALLHRLQQGMPFRLAWSATRPWTGPAQDAAPGTTRLIATLREVLGQDAIQVDVTASQRFRLFKFDPLQVGIEPPSVVARLGTTPVLADQPDVLMPINSRITVQAMDGSWLSADPIGFDHAIMTVALPITALLGGGLIIALMSAWMARRIVAPLDRLIVAAEAIGTSREIVAVRPEGLGEFAAVARAFEDMQHRLTRFVGDRTQMLAAISHDLRSSLTRLRITAENEAVSDGRTAILTEIDDMDTMVGSTLSFATGEALAVPSRSIDIAALLISLVDNAADRGKRCHYDGPDHSETIGHPVSLKRAFSNLIDNAIQYGAAAHVMLSGDGGVVRVAVADEGPGIPPDLVEDSFQPFRRLDPARSGEVRGSGLGLTIARDAVQSHGGTIRMRSGRDGGFAVIVELPRR